MRCRYVWVIAPAALPSRRWRVVAVRRSAHRVHRRVSHLAELSARTIVLGYVMTAVLWIALSDRVLGALVSDPGALVTVSTLKGWAFVAATGTMLATVSYTHLRAHETDSYLVCRLLLEKK